MKIKIDRSIPFDPVTFIPGIFIPREWTIEEEDGRALTLTEVDLYNDVQLVISDDPISAERNGLRG